MKKILFTDGKIAELIVENGSPRGGSIVETFVWIRALNELGFKIQILRDANDLRRIMPEFSWIEIRPSYSQTKGLKWLRWPFYRLPKLYQSLKASNPDFVYDSMPGWSSCFTAYICKILKIKFVMRLMNDNMLDNRVKITHSSFERLLLYKAFKLADAILPQNQYQHERINELFPGKNVGSFFPPFVIDFQYLKLKESPKGYIAWVANFRYQKNLKLLFEIASVITTYQFKIAGAALSYMDEETALYVERLKTLKNVEFVGVVKREEILEFFSKATYLLNTSHYEGFSNAFLESMATGTPILTTGNVNPDGIVNKHGLGLIYSSPDVLKTLLQKTSLDDYREMSQNCIDYIQNHHGHLYLGKKLVGFLEQL